MLDAGGSFGQPFPITEDGAPIVMDLPVDALHPVVLFAEKAASRTEAELGDDVGYQVRVANRSDSTIATLGVRDVLPVGFAYVAGSARVGGAAVADPKRAGGTLEFALGALAPHATVTLAYRLRVGPGASLGEAVNRATASSGSARSNEAVARVTVRGGVFADEGIILGTVGLDADRDGRLSAGEPGLAGVRLVLDDGTWAVTDARGRYSFTGVTPRTHALKVDPSTVPTAATLIALDHRAGGLPGLRFVDLTRGELARADFAAQGDTAALRDVSDHGVASGRPERDRLLARGADPLATPMPASDPRALPASRVLTGESGLPLTRRATGTPGASATATATWPAPAPESGRATESPAPQDARSPRALASLPLEQLVSQLDAEPGFLGLADLDTVAVTQIAVRVKGGAGTHLELFVNGRLEPDTRVARRVIAPEAGIEAREYLGVDLRPGVNVLEVAPAQSLARAAVRVVAPGPLAALMLDAPRGVPADGVTPAEVTLSLLDAHGVPVGARTLVTLESTLGRVRLDDLDPATAGVQIAVEGGRARVPLESPAAPGVARLTAATGELHAVAFVPFTTEPRRLLAVGTLEGVLGWNGFSRRGAAADPREARFESPAEQFASVSRDGRASAAARGAFFLKGRAAGPWSLTLGYDSDRERDARRFRDLQPDAGYTVLGDASVRGYDAQSTGRLYSRLERPGAWLLYGDYVTQGIGSPAEGGTRALAAYNRSFSGAQTHWEEGAVRVDAFTSRDRTRSRVDELPGLGISGPYQLRAFPFVENTERVEVLVRDREHPGVVLSTSARERFTDYEVEPFTGRLLFRAPVPSLDAAMNPVSVRVTYEVRTADGGPAGDPFWVHGATARWQAASALELSGTVVDDHDPAAPRELRGAAFRTRLAPRTTLEGEWALTQRLGTTAGQGGRLELRHAAGGIDAHLWGASTGARFDNPFAGFAGGRDDAGGRLEARLAERTRLTAEASYSGDAAGRDRRGGGLLALDRALSDAWRGQLGVRVSDGTVRANGEDPLVAAVRTRLGWQPRSRPEWTSYAEGEQDVREARRRMAALGSEYRVAGRGRMYARHELISSLGGAFDLNGAQQRLATVLGVDADVRSDQHVFGEYRLADVLAGREAQAAVGLRNGWQVDPDVRLGTSFERVSPLGEGHPASGATTAAALAVDFTGDVGWKGSSRIEVRANRSDTQLLQTLAAAVALDSAWTGLFRYALSVTEAHAADAAGAARARLQVGLAWRPGGRWEGLARWEGRYDRGAAALAPTAMETGDPDPRGRRIAGIVSLHADGPMGDHDVMSIAWAGKLTREESFLAASNGGGQWLRARATRDLADGWDIGWTASALTGSRWSQRRWGLGAELGRQLPMGRVADARLQPVRLPRRRADRGGVDARGRLPAPAHEARREHAAARGRPPMRRAWAARRAALLVAAIALSAAAAAPARAQIVRAFTPRFTTNAPGDITMIGNTLMSCSNGGTCTNGRNGTGGSVNDNDFTMVYVDVDGDASTFSSSTADLALPSGATVLWAGLYWGGDSNNASRGTCRLATPVAGYATITALRVDNSGNVYQGIADVTTQVRAGGNGTYRVANVYSTPNSTNRFAGWGLVVVYQLTSQPMRNLVVFDGFGQVVNGSPITMTVNGFVTPPAGPVRTRLGVLAHEGDLGFTGDAFNLNGVALSNTRNPATNFFNSSISRFDTTVTAKNPNYLNQLGFDIDMVNADGRLANNATSATIQLTSNGDTYFPGVVSFATDLYAPVIDGDSFQKRVVDSNGGSVRPGDVLEYTLVMRNVGQDNATQTVMRDTLPASVSYVSGSLSVVSGANAGAKTDAAGDDQMEYLAAARAVVARVGTGANAATGGQINVNDSTVVRFRVTVNVPTPSGTVVGNQAGIAYVGAQTGATLLGRSDGDLATGGAQPTNVTVVAAKLSGTVFEDANYGGGAGRSLLASGGAGRPGARVELYGSSGAYLDADTTGATGAYAFDGWPAGSYTVRVVGASVTSSRSGAAAGQLPVQTFRTVGSSGTAVADPDRVGGETPALADAAANTSAATLASLTTGAATPQSVTPVVLGTADVAGLDFGFNFDTIVNANDSGQGSLRQFIVHADALGNAGLAQAGLPAGLETSVFMVSDGLAHPGLRAGLANLLTAGVVRVTLASALPALSDAGTRMDGSTQSRNVGDTAAGLLGTGGVVGAEDLPLPQLPAPEVEVRDGAGLAIGFDVTGANVTLRALAITGFGNAAGSDSHADVRIGAAASGARLERCAIGTTATSFTDPGALRSGGDHVRALGGDNGVIDSCLIAFGAGNGLALTAGSNGWNVTATEFRQNAQSASARAGVSVESSGALRLARSLVIEHPGPGVDAAASAGGDRFDSLTVRRSGLASVAGVPNAGLRIGGAGSRVDRCALADNVGAGVMVTRDRERGRDHAQPRRGQWHGGGRERDHRPDRDRPAGRRRRRRARQRAVRHAQRSRRRRRRRQWTAELPGAGERGALERPVHASRAGRVRARPSSCSWPRSIRAVSARAARGPPRSWRARSPISTPRPAPTPAS